MAGGGGDEVARAVGPFHEQHRAAREVVLPADRQHVVRVVEAVEVHVDEQDPFGGMFHHEAEGGARHGTLCAECGGES